jgi:hypothetical protein
MIYLSISAKQITIIIMNLNLSLISFWELWLDFLIILLLSAGITTLIYWYKHIKNKPKIMIDLGKDKWIV